SIGSGDRGQGRPIAEIWMPAMAITSRDIQGTEVISTSVTVSQDGSISKVQRVIAKMKNPFRTEKYPFDEQTLQIITSSSKYMASEVKLEPLKDSKILDDAFTGKGFTMEKFDVTAYEEQSGPLIKFRGRMEVVIKRGRTKWYVGTLTAALSMVLASYGVFWLPFLGPFAMPRMALSIISYLALAQIMGAYMNNIAGVAGMSWGEFFFQTFGMLSFFAVLINILSPSPSSSKRSGRKAPWMCAQTMARLQISSTSPSCCAPFTAWTSKMEPTRRTLSSLSNGRMAAPRAWCPEAPSPCSSSRCRGSRMP
ncbi:unnamed protein product, partial [Effrenium voratum]